MKELVNKTASDIVKAVDYCIWKDCYNEDTAECDPNEVEDNIFELSQIIQRNLKDVFEKASLFDAMINQEKIVVSNEINGKEKYQRMSIEMWSRHLSSECEDVKADTQRSVSLIINYLKTHANALKNGSSK